MACPAVEAVALEVGGVAFPNGDRERCRSVLKRLHCRWPGRKNCGRRLKHARTQQGLVAVAFVPVLAIAPEAFYLEETLLASLPPAVGGACGCRRLWPDADLGRRWWR